MSPKTRRDFLTITAASAASVAFMKAFPSAALMPSETQIPDEKTPSGTMAVRITTGDQRYASSPSLAWQSANRAPSENAIVLGAVRNSQPILGFGAAFTDAACYVIHQMPEAERERLLQELFHPDQMALSVCRMCVGSSDYSRNIYSYDEGAPDPELSRFSIAHDREYILPVLRRARQI